MSGPASASPFQTRRKPAALVLLANRGHTPMVAELLRESGFEVAIGGKPATAMERLQAERFRLLVVDQVLSDGTPAAVFIRKLRRDAEAASRKVWALALVTTATAATVTELRLAGVSGLLVGSPSVRAFAERLDVMRLDKRRFVSAAGYCGPDRRIIMAFVSPERDRRQAVAESEATS